MKIVVKLCKPTNSNGPVGFKDWQFVGLVSVPGSSALDVFHHT